MPTHPSAVLSVVARGSEEAARTLGRFDTPGWLWLAFLGAVALLLLLDLLVLHREAHEIGMREATWSSVFWIALGLLFAIPVLQVLGSAAALQYLTGYVIEKSLSVDNVFVWAVIFQTFAIPSRYQHRVLFWGIFGALVLRAVFILSGVALLERMSWLLFVFGGILVFTAWRIATHEVGDVHPERNPLLKLLRRFVPVTADFHGQRLFARVQGRLLATPLFVTLVLVEGTDVVFAVDSVPAILAVSRDPFVVFSSNAMAILGLRALYFLLLGAQGKLVHLNKGLAVILAFVGVKMIISPWFHVPTLLSLAVIVIVLAITVRTSLSTLARRQKEGAA
jgi:tellurite resistance protein TerC